MRYRSLVGSAIVGFSLTALGCGLAGPKGPTREEVTAQLQQEANALKQGGEKLDPVLRVKATWNVVGLEITERPDDPDKPWAGTIRFRIKSETKDSDGKVEVDEFDKRFDYLYTMSLKRWIFQMPPS